MRTRILSETEFKSTFSLKMVDVRLSATDVIDVWPYVDSVPTDELEGHSIFERFVEFVCRTDDGRFDHVLVLTKTKNVYLVVVIDLVAVRIVGHHLLDLNKEYRLT